MRSERRPRTSCEPAGCRTRPRHASCSPRNSSRCTTSPKTRFRPCTLSRRSMTRSRTWPSCRTTVALTVARVSCCSRSPRVGCCSPSRSGPLIRPTGSSSSLTWCRRLPSCAGAPAPRSTTRRRHHCCSPCMRTAVALGCGSMRAAPRCLAASWYPRRASTTCPLARSAAPSPPARPTRTGRMSPASVGFSSPAAARRCCRWRCA